MRAVFLWGIFLVYLVLFISHIPRYAPSSNAKLSSKICPKAPRSSLLCYSFLSHQSCTSSTLLLPKYIYPQKSATKLLVYNKKIPGAIRFGDFLLTYRY